MSKQFQLERVPSLAAAVSQLEFVLSACDSGILRHHFAEQAATAGPPWAQAMWAWECMWGQLVK